MSTQTWTRVAHQAMLARRSMSYLRRHPSAGTELGRLVATMGKSTTRLRLPWLPFRLIRELDEFLSPGSTVFEYGGGGSTLWFLDRGHDVVTVEHDPEWAERLSGLVSDSNWTLLHRSSENLYSAYVDSVDNYPEGWFDVVLVDGRERVRCALKAAGHVRPGGWLIIDDFDRDRYGAGLVGLRWPRRDVVGFAPAKPTLAYTAVFTRPVRDG